MRFLDGLAGSAFLSVAGGTVGDVFSKEELSLPMMIYTASPFLGPEIGPVVGGFINQFADWRWSFWVLVIWSGLYWFLILAFVPETYVNLMSKTVDGAMHQCSSHVAGADLSTHHLDTDRFFCEIKPLSSGRRPATKGGRRQSKLGIVLWSRRCCGAAFDRFSCYSLNRWS